MPNCYDLVGTLANVTYPAQNLTSVIYKPRGQFTIITAQGTGSHAHLYAQVREQFPNCTRIITVRTGTDEQEGQRKARVLKRLNAHTYTDNNINILRTIKRLLPDITLYKMNSNGSKREVNG